MQSKEVDDILAQLSPVLNQNSTSGCEAAGELSRGGSTEGSGNVAGVTPSFPARVDSSSGEDDVAMAPADELERLGIRPLWNNGMGKAPAYANHKEKPEHRLIGYLKATGLTNREIASRVGFHPVTINYLVRQPFMQLIVLEEIKRSADPALQLISNEAFASAERLIQIAKEGKNEEVRRKANLNLLEIKYGKPNQPMSMSSKAVSDMTDDELNRIIAQSQSN